MNDSPQEPGFYRDPDARGFRRYRYWTGSEWHHTPVRPSHLTALRRLTVVAAAFTQLFLVFVMYAFVAGESNQMTVAEEAAAGATEGRAVLVCLGLIAVLAVVQVVVGWPTVRAKLTSDRPGPNVRERTE